MEFKTECYGIECDNCLDIFEDGYSGFSLFADEGTARYSAENNGWIWGDGDEGEKGKCYCGSCHSFDDEDRFVLNTERTKVRDGQ